MRMSEASSSSKKLARHLRDNLTEWEKILWSRLGRFKKAGYHFRRQVAIGPYVADFACKQARVIVEADGGHHGEPKQVAHDAKRDAWLREQGYLILRYSNHEIRRELDGVCDGIFHALKARLSIANMIAERDASIEQQDMIEAFNKRFEAGAAPTRPAPPDGVAARPPPGGAVKEWGAMLRHLRPFFDRPAGGGLIFEVLLRISGWRARRISGVRRAPEDTPVTNV
jgi:very-short-patch-repair endonuclease